MAWWTTARADADEDNPHGGAQVAPGLAIVLGEVAAGVLDDRLVLLLRLLRRTRQLEHATRERGYAISDEDVTPGIATLGAPIVDHTGAVRASLSVGGIRAQLFEDRERAIDMLRGAAAEISRTLGYDASLAC